MQHLNHFKIGTVDDPVEKLSEMENLRVKLNNGGISVDDNTWYACLFLPGLLPSTRSRFQT